MPLLLRQSNDILSYKGIDKFINPTCIVHEDKMGLNKVFKELYKSYNLSEKLYWYMQHIQPAPVTGSIYSFRFKDLPDISYIITKLANSDYYTKENLEIVLKSLKDHFKNFPSRSVCVMPLLSGNIRSMKRSEVLDLHYKYLNHLNNLIFISQYPNKNNPLLYINIITDKEYTDVNKIDNKISEILIENKLKLTNIVIPVKEGFNELFQRKSKYKDKIIPILVNKRYGEKTISRYSSMIGDLCDIFIIDKQDIKNKEKLFIYKEIEGNNIKRIYEVEGENS